jgi:hypothetical protein
VDGWDRIVYEQTRALGALAIQRVSGYMVEFITLSFSPNGDGSFSTTTQTEQMRAAIVDLSMDEIKRLQSGGITINSGVTCSVPYQLAQVPDQVRYIGELYKVIDYVISQGITTMTLTQTSAGVAQIESGAH